MHERYNMGIVYIWHFVKYFSGFDKYCMTHDFILHQVYTIYISSSPLK